MCCGDLMAVIEGPGSNSSNNDENPTQREH